MALFGRNKASRHDDVTTEETGNEDVVAEDSELSQSSAVDEDSEEISDDLNDAEVRRRRNRLRPREDVDLSHGPFDAASAPEATRLDFGAIALAPGEDVELRLDVDENTQLITGMTALLGENGTSGVQLQAFAAPKTSGIWYGIRREIAEALIAGGGTAEEIEGPLGTELHARMPSQGPDGRVTYSPARFVGVDGPRWFLRAVFSGEAAVDDEASGRAYEFLRSVVVRRGSEARAPRELLELTIPQELLEQIDPEANGAETSQPGQASDSSVQSGPLERGPEITEIR